MTTIKQFSRYKDEIKHTELSQKDYPNIIEANIFIKEVYHKNTKPLKEFFADIGEKGYEHFLEHLKKFEMDEFDWGKLVNQIPSMRRITRYDKFTTIKSNPALHWTILDSKLYQDAFPLTLISEYVKRPNYMFGTPIYDKALRLQCDLLQIFLLFHLKHDFRFHPKMSAGKYKVIDPFTRIKIREKNRNDKKLQEKYFNKDFNLKDFIFKLYDYFFPNVSWRYIGAGHFAHRITIQLTEFLYQIGLWEYEDQEKIMAVLLEKSENLLFLENSCIKDSGKLSTKFNGEMSNLFCDAREYISNIILHKIMLINDKSLQEGLTWTRKSKGVFHYSSGMKWPNVYFKDREFNFIANTIMMKFVMRDKTAIKGDNKYCYTNDTIKTNLDNIFMMMTDCDYDVFHISQDLVNDKLLSFYNDEAGQYQKIRDESHEITQNLISLVDDLTRGEFGNVAEMKSSQKTNKVIKYVSDWVSKFLEGQQELIYFKQLALGENNVVTILLLFVDFLLNLEDENSKLSVSLRLILQSITLICENNLTTQAQLFQEQGLTYFKNLNEKRPLLGALVTTNIFRDNNKILYVNPETFTIILDFYKTKLKDEAFSLDIDEIMKNPDDITRKISNLLALDKFNQYLGKLVQVHRIDTKQRKPYYDLVIQEVIRDIIVEKVLPILSDPDFLPKVDDFENKMDKYDFSFTIMNSSMNDQQILEWAQSEKHDKNIVTGLIYDICLSFLRLFNKVTHRMVYSSTYLPVSKKLDDVKDKFQDYLFNFKEGIFIKIEVLRIYSTFKVFFSNTLLTDRFANNKVGGILYMEAIIPKEHIKREGADTILRELKVENFNKLMRWYESNDTWQREKLKDYCFKGLFPMIYKFVKAVSTLYYLNNKIKNEKELPILYKLITDVFEALHHVGPIISKMIGADFLSKVDITLLKANETDAKTQPIRNYQEMDREEIFYEDIYRLRKKAANMMYMIESVYPSNYNYLLLRYSRVTAIKRPQQTTEIAEKMKELKFSSYFLDNKEFDEDTEDSSVKSQKYQEFCVLRDYYKEDKEVWTKKRGKENLLISYFDNNLEQIPNVLQFILKSIHTSLADYASTCENQDSIISAFFQSKFVFPYIIFLDKLIFDYEKMKIVLFYFLNDNPKFNPEVMKRAKDICENNKELIAEINNAETKKQFHEVLSIMYYLFVEFGQFCMYKTFIDEEWKSIWDKYFIIGNFIKNLCENGSVYFKEYLGVFIPAVSMGKTTKFNIKKRTLFFDLYVRVESFSNNSLSWKIRDKRLVIADRPELFLVTTRLFEIITEFVNGPCPINQRKIYRFRTDIWMGTVTRNVNDVNSQFYAVKDKIIDYLLALIEGEGSFPLGPEIPSHEDTYLATRYIATNMTSRYVIEAIYYHLKKLALYRKMERFPRFRDRINQKIKKKREKEYQNFLINGERTQEEINVMRAKVKAQEEMFNQYEDPNAVITDDMMEAYEFSHYKELYWLYKHDSVFANHKIIQIALKLYTFLDQLGAESKAIRAALKNIKMKISKFYAEEVDADDAVSVEGKDLLIKLASKLPENLIFFMFILKISKKIEISVSLPTKKGSVNKVVFFPVLPQTLYLEENTKKQTIKEVDLEGRREDFQSRFPEFFDEMDYNYNFNLTNRFFYILSKNDTFYYQKMICWTFSFLLNIVILFLYELNDNAEPDSRRLEFRSYGTTVDLVSLIFAGYTFIQFLLWLFFRYPTRVKTRRIRYKTQNNLLKIVGLKTKIGIAYTTFINDKSAISFISHTIFAVMGVYVNPVFHTFHLLLITNISSTAEYVVKASTAHGNQLMITLILAIFLIFSFAVLNAEYYSASFDGDAVNNIDVCKTLRSCTIYILNMGLRNGGGIGDSEKLYAFDNAKLLSKTLFDLLFFFLINVISLNIVFGIIIDTFSELRESASNRQEDLESHCFICLNEESVFNALKIDYELHKEVHHDMWLYPLYIKYLIHKNDEDYDGNEIAVWNKYKEGITDWIPLRTSNFLDNAEVDENQGESVDTLALKMKRMETKIDQIRKLVIKSNKGKDDLDLDLDLSDLDLK